MLVESPAPPPAAAVLFDPSSALMQGAFRPGQHTALSDAELVARASTAAEHLRRLGQQRSGLEEAAGLLEELARRLASAPGPAASTAAADPLPDDAALLGGRDSPAEAAVPFVSPASPSAFEGDGTDV